ncbi:MAG: nuclear transport factor 2 family protein [Planctomycetota bacterium]
MFENAEAALTAWLDGVNNGDLDTVEGMYSEDAVLLPTFSSRIRRTVAERRDYFEGLAKHENVTVELHDSTLDVHSLADSLFSLSGIYCWTFDVDGETLHFEARFTYTIDITKEAPILHHHSSQVPRGLQ